MSAAGTLHWTDTRSLAMRLTAWPSVSGTPDEARFGIEHLVEEVVVTARTLVEDERSC
jgi:hypothetical protein